MSLVLGTSLFNPQLWKYWLEMASGIPSHPEIRETLSAYCLEAGETGNSREDDTGDISWFDERLVKLA
jgi:hypothetical protein